MADLQQHRYPFLDALRGIAAILVLFYHIKMRFGGETMVENGYLAVDFFFILSGFVIAAAYERRLANSLSFAQFAHRRLIRLLPMSVLGVALGTAYLLMRWIVQPGVSDSLAELLAASALNLVLLPKLWVASATGNELFPANGALWSLFFELAINLLWAAFLVMASLRVLFAVALAGGLLFAASAVAFGTADIGWNLDSMGGGLGRVTFGFTAGIILFRLRDRLRVQRAAAPWLALALLCAVVLMPTPSLAWTLPAVFVLLPLTMVLGLGAGSRRILPAEDLLGRLSYPLYAIHVPLLMLASGVQKRLFPEADLTFVSLLLAVPIIALALAALRLYDEPLRDRLTSRWGGAVPALR